MPRVPLSCFNNSIFAYLIIDMASHDRVVSPMPSPAGCLSFDGRRDMNPRMDLLRSFRGEFPLDDHFFVLGSANQTSSCV